MEHPLSLISWVALVPELSSDVAAGSPGHIQLVRRLRAGIPTQVFRSSCDDLNLAVKPAFLAEIALCINSAYMML